MFDQHIRRTEVMNVHETSTHTAQNYSTVTEKRAPTDESIRLLREMEAAAKASVLKAIRVANTEFECVIHTKNDHLNGRLDVMAVFQMNGKRCVVNTYVDPFTDKGHDAVTRLVNEVAKEVAHNIIGASITKALADELFVK